MISAAVVTTICMKNTLFDMENFEDAKDREFDFLVGVYDICDNLRDDSEEIDDKSSFIIRALSQQMYNFYKDHYPNDLDLEIEVMQNTMETLELDQDYELCAVYREAIRLLKNYQHEQEILLP